MTKPPFPQTRAPRQQTSFPVTFVADGCEPIFGTCENLSESGLLAVFSTPPEIWSEGTLDLQFGVGLIGLAARVARVVDLRAGFAFHALGDEHLGKLREILQAELARDALIPHL